MHQRYQFHAPGQALFSNALPRIVIPDAEGHRNPQTSSFLLQAVPNVKNRESENSCGSQFRSIVHKPRQTGVFGGEQDVRDNFSMSTRSVDIHFLFHPPARWLPMNSGMVAWPFCEMPSRRKTFAIVFAMIFTSSQKLRWS